MEKYTKEIQIASQMSDTVGGKTNRSMRKKLATKVNQSGIDFLARIHEECKGQIGATEDELEEEKQLLLEQTTAIAIQKPELTMEYLKSIGREDMGSW